MGRHRNLAMLIGLALIWGASFLFIKVAVRELTPATLIVGRLGLAAITLGLLVPFVVGTGETMRQLRANWRLARRRRAREHRDPVLAALVGRDADRLRARLDHPGVGADLQRADRLRRLPRGARDRRAAGSASRVGFVGVALLVGAQPQGKVLGALAVVGMAFCYGVGGLLSGRYLKPAQPVVVSFASTAIATLVWLPVGVAEAPEPHARLEDDRLAWSPSASPEPRSPTCSSSA